MALLKTGSRPLKTAGEPPEGRVAPIAMERRRTKMWAKGTVNAWVGDAFDLAASCDRIGASVEQRQTGHPKIPVFLLANRVWFWLTVPRFHEKSHHSSSSSALSP